MNETDVEILLGIFNSVRTNKLPLSIVKGNLEQHFQFQAEKDASRIAEAIIQYALDHYVIDKIVDYPRPEHEMAEVKRVWFLKVLNEDESKKIENSSELEHALRRLLHSCESGYRLGAEKAEVIISRLNEMGFEVQDQLLTSEQVDSAFTSENGIITQWYYLIPEDESSEEYEET